MEMRYGIYQIVGSGLTTVEGEIFEISIDSLPLLHPRVPKFQLKQVLITTVVLHIIKINSTVP